MTPSRSACTGGSRHPGGGAGGDDCRKRNLCERSSSPSTELRSSGTTSSARFSSGTRKPAPNTPTTRRCVPLMSMRRPTTLESAPYRRRHSASLNTTTGSAPAESASGENHVPSAGCAPSTDSRLALTRAPRTRSGVPSCVSAMVPPATAARPAKARPCSRRRRYMRALTCPMGLLAFLGAMQLHQRPASSIRRTGAPGWHGRPSTAPPWRRCLTPS